MKLRFWMLSIFAALILSSPALWAQDLGPGFTKVKDGIYVFASKEGNSTCSIVLTQEGAVVIDSCQTPFDTQKFSAGIKKLTDKPIRFAFDSRPQGKDAATVLYGIRATPTEFVIGHDGRIAAVESGYTGANGRTTAAVQAALSLPAPVQPTAALSSPASR